MSGPKTLADAALLIASEPAPVLLLDTCALLDVLRVPLRRSQLRSGVVGAAQAALDADRARPRRIWLVVASLVIRELDEHIGDVEVELAAFLRHVDQDVSHVLAVLDLLLPTPPARPPLSTFSDSDLVSELSRLARGLAESAIVLAEDDACLARARHRSIDGRAPAAKGKESRKDCEILEHYLELCRLLDRAALREKRVLVSSNTKDYRIDGAGKDESLKADISSVTLLFARELAWAVATSE